MTSKISKYALFMAAVAALFTSLQSYADFPEGKHSIHGALAFTKGGEIAIGADYEYGYDRTYGLGAMFRMIQDDTDTGAPGITLLGGFVRPHFNRQNWDLFLSPGFGFIMVDPVGNADDETLLGPSLGMGLMYEFTPAFALGIENLIAAGWFGEDAYLGTQYEEIFVKFRFIF